MKQFWITILGLASVGWAFAQDIPPLPPLRGDAATLNDTMKFLNDKLPSKVNYTMSSHNTITGTDSAVVKKSYEVSYITTNAYGCSIRYNRQVDGQPLQNGSLPLKQVQDVVLQPMDQVTQRAVAQAGHPEVNISISPAIFQVVAKIDSTHGLLIMYYDETLADRVSKALQHAVDLCGGGNKDPF
jgi:hypothetical protein